MSFTEVWTAPVGTVYSQYVEYDKIGKMTYTRCGDNLWVDQNGEHYTDQVISDCARAAEDLGHPMALHEIGRPTPDDLVGKIAVLLTHSLEAEDADIHGVLFAALLATDIMKLVRGEGEVGGIGVGGDGSE